MGTIMLIIRRNIARQPLQMLLFAICCILSTGFLLCTITLNSSLEDSFDHAYAQIDAPDMTICISQAQMPEQELQDWLGQADFINESLVCRRYLANKVSLPERDMNFAYVMTGGPEEIPYGSVIINNAVTGVSIGDKLTLFINNQEVELTVTGIKEDVINSAPDVKIPYFWINAQQAEEIMQCFNKGEYLVWITFHEYGQGLSEAELTGSYEEFYGKPFDATMQTYEQIRDSYLFRYEIISRFFLAVSIVTACIALMITWSLSKMIVATEQSKIGILKAIGFGKEQLCLIYVLQFVLVAIISSILGSIVTGLLLRGWLSQIMRNIDSHLFQIEGLAMYQIGIPILFSLLLGGLVWLSVRKMVRFTPVGVMKGEAAKHSNKCSASILVSDKKGLLLNLAFIKLLKQKGETILLFVMVFGMAVLTLFSLLVIDGVRTADKHLEDWGIAALDVYVARKANVDELESGLLEELKKNENVDYSYAALNDYVVYRQQGKTGTVIGEVFHHEINPKLIYEMAEGRNPRNTQEIAIGINFARENKVGIGDTIEILRNGQTQEYIIVGVYPSYNNRGNSVRLIVDDIIAFFDNQATGYYSIVLKPEADLYAFAAAMTQQFPEFDFIPLSRSTTRSVMMLLPPMLITLGILWLLLLWIETCIMRIFFLQQQKENRIYSAIGYSRQQLRRVYRYQYGMITTGAVICAIPVSLFAVPRLLAPVAEQLGLCVIPVYPNAGMMLVALAGMLLLQEIAMRMAGKYRRSLDI